MLEKTITAQPATALPTIAPTATPEPDALLTPPPTPYADKRAADEAERAALKGERDDNLSKVIALQLLRDGCVEPSIKARRTAIQDRLAEIDEREIALEPFVRKEERRTLIYNQEVALKQRREVNQVEAARVQAALDDVDQRKKKLEDELHYWKNKAPDGVFSASLALAVTAPNTQT